MKNGQMTKRFLSLLIAVMVLCCMLMPPTYVMAATAGEGTQNKGEVSTSDYIAKIGEDKYSTLDEAVEAAKAGDTITLLKDVDATAGAVVFAKDATLDLNGFNIKTTNSMQKNIQIVDGAKLILQDSSEASNGKIYTEIPYGGIYTTGAIVVNGEGSQLIMESGNIETVQENAKDNGQFAVSVKDGGDVTINGGQIKAGWYAIAGNGKCVVNDSKFVVNGGTLISTADYAIYNPQSGSTTINGGTVFGATGGVSMNRGDLNVTGGVITSKGQGSTGNWGDGTGGQSNAAISISAKYGNVNAKISGGTISAEGDAVIIGTSKYDYEVSVTGGTFSSDPSEFLPEGYVSVEKDSKYSVGLNVSEIKLDKTQLSMNSGDIYQLTATVLPAKAFDKTVTWSLEGDAVKLDKTNGRITAVKAGKATVTATSVFNNKISTSCEIIVTERPAEAAPTVTIEPNTEEKVTEDGTIKVISDDDVIAIFETVKAEDNKTGADVVIEMPANVTPQISENIFEKAKENNIETLVVATPSKVDSSGNITSYASTFEFNTNEIDSAKLVPVNTEIKPNKEIITTGVIPEGTKTLGISLTHDGAFPATAKITMQLDDMDVVEGDTIYLYYDNNGTLELIENGKLVVGPDKKVSFSLKHASNYVFTTKKTTKDINNEAVAPVITKINGIGTVAYTSASKIKIDAARAAYNSLTAIQKKLVTNYATLTSAETKYAGLKAAAEKAIADKNAANSAITKISLTKCKLSLSYKSIAYTGKSKLPTVKVSYKSKKLVKNTNYTITYKNNKSIGKATVTVKGKGKYTGTKTLTFKIIPKTESIKSVKSAKKAFTVKWKADAQATGYQILIAKNSKYTKSKKTITSKGKKVITKKITKLSKKSKYYVKVRTYKVVKGTKYYGNWSKAKIVKTK